MDRPDDFAGYQLHVVYALPNDAVDEELDRDGTIERAVEGINDWLDLKGNANRLRFDTYKGQLDVTCLKVDMTDVELQNTRNGAIWKLRELAVEAGLLTPGKILVVFYGSDGVPDSGNWLGNAYEGFNVTYLKCNPDFKWGFTVKGGTWEQVALHEICHSIGMKAASGDSHVNDSKDDILSAPASWAKTLHLDFNRDDYFAHRDAHRSDFNKSLMLLRPTDDARPPNGWPYTVSPVVDGLDPMAGTGLPAVAGEVQLEQALLDALNAARTGTGGAALPRTESLHLMAGVTAHNAVQEKPDRLFNLPERAGHWGPQTVFTLSPPDGADAGPATIQALVEQVMASSSWKTALLDPDATEIAVGAVRANGKLAIAVGIGKAEIEVRRLRLGETRYGVYGFSGEVRALKKLPYPQLLVESGGKTLPWRQPLGMSKWVPFAADVPKGQAGSFHRVALRLGDSNGSVGLGTSWNFNGGKPLAECMDLPTASRPVLSIGADRRPHPVEIPLE